MGKRRLQDRSLDQLTERFVELVLAVETACDAKAAGYRDEIQDIERELKARGSDHHTDLLPLATRPDETLRMEAVAATFRMMTGNPDVDARLVHHVALATNAPFLEKTSSVLDVPQMPREILGTLTTEALVDRFVAIGLAQDEAMLYREIDKFNSLFDQVVLVALELKSREGDQRHVLLPLYDHANLQVRLNALNSTLALAPVEARRVLQAIVDSTDKTHAHDAAMTLSVLEREVLNQTGRAEGAMVAEERMPVADMTDEQLVERFVVIGEAQRDAKLYDDTPEFNRLYDLKVEVVGELQLRPGDQRSLLLPLYSHENLQVRLNAVTGTLALAPQEGRRALQEVADSMKQPYAGDAGMTLWTLDEGIFKPE